ncbi:SRPBCC family protein [Phycicoccus avicenniae]|uniref:SRPBCC family protein n=1 Tax=Phycicoccus avicenniae TaxID=2828860 RepID=UPI003D29A67B
MTTRDVVSVQRLIPAPPEPIFDLLADPAGHQRIDGGGSVTGARSGGRRLALGDRFGMDMKIGVAYSTSNTVIEFEENRRIAWQTLAGGALKSLVGGRIWRYELEPVEGGTLVTESWDITQEAATSKPVVRRMEGMTRKNMAATLERIEELVAQG